MYHIPRNKFFKAFRREHECLQSVAQLSSPWASFPSLGKWVADRAVRKLLWGGEEGGEPPSFLPTLTLNYTTAASGKKKTTKTARALLPFLPLCLLSFLPFPSFVLSFPSFLPPSLPYFPSFSPQLTHLPLLLLLSLLLPPHLLPLYSPSASCCLSVSPIPLSLLPSSLPPFLPVFCSLPIF